MESVQKNSVLIKIGMLLTILSGVGALCSFLLAFTPLSIRSASLFFAVVILLWAALGLLCLGLPFLNEGYLSFGSTICSVTLSTDSASFSDSVAGVLANFGLTAANALPKITSIVFEVTFGLLIVSIVLCMLKKNDKSAKKLLILNFVFVAIMVAVLVLFVVLGFKYPFVK